VADAALVLVGDELRLVPLDGAREPVENLGSLPLADVDVTDSLPVVSGTAARAAHDAALDDWLRLTAATLVGIGARALEIGAQYAKERKAWGVPIGSY
jgi:hypothetical protein